MSTLTSHQLEVVAHPQGHARVVAVAGAGKTTTLTHFIQQRLQQGDRPRRMLVLMYNKAAQLDFQRKLHGLLPDQSLPEVRTFHSLGLRIYKKLIEMGELPPFDGSLLSDSELDTVVWRMLQQLADDETRQDILSQRKKWVEPACGFIDLVKSGLSPAAEVFEALELPPECRIFIELFDQFEEWRKDQRRIGFADMIWDPVQLLVRRADLAAFFGGHMQWILVDEYQDINEIQQQLLQILYGGRGSVMVIGDPDQTIYEFRGSRPEFIVSGFDEQMGEVAVYQLPETFRYGPKLSLLANHLIHHNREREAVICRSHAGTPATAIEMRRSAPAQEAAAVLELVRQQLQHCQPNDIAVICRIWALCAPIELALLQANIPYQLDHSLSVLDRWELEIFWLLLEIAAGRFGERSPQRRREAWLTILTTPYPKIRRQVLEQIADELANHSQNFGRALQRAIPDTISRWQKEQLLQRAEVLDSAELLQMPAWRLLNTYIDVTDLEQGVRDSAFSAQQVEDRLQTIKAFVQFIGDSQQSSDTAYDFLLELRERARQQNGRGSHGVRLTSIHKSKGLEWSVVIIPGLNGHYFPYRPEGAFTTPASVESERRLLYVAMTRARQQLFLLGPVVKRGLDVADRELDSPFWQELNLADCEAIQQALEQSQTEAQISRPQASWLAEYLQATGQQLQLLVKRPPKPESASGKPALMKPGLTAGPAGRRIEHALLGKGRVVKLDERYLTVQFDGESSNRVLLLEAVKQQLRWLD
ncbi:ATP-dependent helicase [Oceanobacter mangrovi]|uniref:ATP-dependent helicase n=1 Tax=Oceanobacter mangrovi TaxID=2862510 RepID=UPI001C8D311C|nr:ATP-dependent helicase [Oceanobacter mangrovi]